MASSSDNNLNGIQVLTILGSTGSIGTSTLDVCRRHPDKFSLFALTANNNIDILFQQCQDFQPQYAVMRDESAAKLLREKLSSVTGNKTEVLSGVSALIEVAEASEVDSVMAAIVGAAGLLPTLAAVKSGKKVLLANKEALVMAGKLFMDAVVQSGANLLPIDSEHNAIFQCLPINDSVPNNALDANARKGIRKLLLTGSGGPFRQWSSEQLVQATPEQACKHPNWSMGKKISVDSATLMNKGLEFIEARWLFDMPPEDIQVVIHPQSIIHSMVEYVDGSVLAQLGHPDMRTPIAHALAWPDRINSGVGSLDWSTLSGLDFEEPDIHRFPALSLAISAASAGSGAPVVLNAANEVAVDAFLQKQIGFTDISDLLQEIMSSLVFGEPNTIDDVVHLDSLARTSAVELVTALSGKTKSKPRMKGVLH
ncbi:MAG: 1-deoxy-D-xylulose-5-phosphate reductoisomerase [Cellvibrionaceae bacterium]